MKVSFFNYKKHHSNKYIYNIKTFIGINTHNNYHKGHKAKCIITACIPKITIKKFLLFFFIKYKNEYKQHKF